MHKRSSLFFVLLIYILASGSSCSNSATAPEPTRTTGIELEPTDFWPIVSGQGFYELWLGVPAAPVPEGENSWEVEQIWTASAAFRIDGEGKIRELRGELIERFPIPKDLDAAAIARGVITYQTSSDVGGPHEMGEWLAVGDFVAPGGTITTDLTWDSPEVIDKDLLVLAGSVRIRTETAEDGPLLPNGLWFYHPSDPDRGGPQTPSLVLGSPLPEGYVYQSWAFQRGLSSLLPLQLYALGRFDRASGADSDGAGPYSVLGAPFPAYPGQDFVIDAVIDFSDGSWTTMITIEPQIDPMPQVPSSLRVLERSLTIASGINVPQDLINRAAEDRLPKSFVKIVR